GFVGVQHGATDLGGAAHATDEETGCKRVQGAAVTGLAGIQCPLRPLQGVIAGEAFRLVQQQDTVEQLPASFRGPHNGIQYSKSRSADVPDQPPGRIVWNLLYPGAA